MKLFRTVQIRVYILQRVGESYKHVRKSYQLSQRSFQKCKNNFRQQVPHSAVNQITLLGKALFIMTGGIENRCHIIQEALTKFAGV